LTDVAGAGSPFVRIMAGLADGAAVAPSPRFVQPQTTGTVNTPLVDVVLEVRRGVRTSDSSM